MDACDLLRPWFERRGWLVVDDVDSSKPWRTHGEHWPILVFSAHDDVYVCVEFIDHRLYCSILREESGVTAYDFVFEPRVQFDLRRPDALEILDRELVQDLLGLKPGEAGI